MAGFGLMPPPPPGHGAAAIWRWLFYPRLSMVSTEPRPSRARP